jgi:F-type H+-transporting ATPase subunit delta
VTHRIAESRRRRDGAVLAEFTRFVRLERERNTAIVEAATTLGPDARKDIQTRLKRMYGAGLETSFVQTPDLIGGMRIKIGSDVYDGSVRARLAAIEACF